MPSFHQIQEWQDEYYSGLNATIKKAQENVVHDDPSIKDYPFAIVHREWMSVIGAAVGYIIRNKPIEYLKARYELASWTQSKTDHWLRFRLSVTELFDYLRSLSKYCCWSLIGKIQCPTYSEELLFNAIQNNDFEAYSEICRTEKLNLFDLSLAAGFLWSPPKPSDNDEELSNEEFGARFERNLIVAGTNIDSTNSFFSRLAGRLNEPYCNLDYPHREMVGMIVKELIDIIVYYDFFELYEKEAINELLDNPEYDDLLAEAQLFYYSRYHELPSRMKVLIDLDSWEDEDGQETKSNAQPGGQVPGGDGKPDWVPSDYQWPDRSFFVKDEHFIKAPNSIKLIDELAHFAKSDEEYERFKKFMVKVAVIGKIDSVPDMEALIQFFTGRKMDNAADKLTWYGAGPNARNLVYIVQQIGDGKEKFKALKNPTLVCFKDITDTEKQTLQPKESSVNLAGRIQDFRGMDPELLLSLTGEGSYDCFSELNKFKTKTRD